MKVPDGRYLASGALDSSVIVTDIKSKAIINQISIAGWVHGVHLAMVEACLLQGVTETSFTSLELTLGHRLGQ